jgi:hypothetical protein
MKEKDVRDRYLNTVTINIYNYLWLTRTESMTRI